MAKLGSFWTACSNRLPGSSRFSAFSRPSRKSASASFEDVSDMCFCCAKRAPGKMISSNRTVRTEDRILKRLLLIDILSSLVVELRLQIEWQIPEKLGRECAHARFGADYIMPVAIDLMHAAVSMRQKAWTRNGRGGPRNFFTL